MCNGLALAVAVSSALIGTRPAVSVPDHRPVTLRGGTVAVEARVEDGRLLDTIFDFLPPVHGGWDAFPIDPEIKILTFEAFSQLARKFNILARIGNEQTSHGWATL